MLSCYIANTPLKVVDALGLSYKTANELNAFIDKKLAGYPSFKSSVVEIGGEQLQLHHRDVLECIRVLYGNPEFAHDLVFAPERHYLDSGQKCRVYSEMHTGDWWWSVQVRNVYFGVVNALKTYLRRHLNYEILVQRSYR